MVCHNCHGYQSRMLTAMRMFALLRYAVDGLWLLDILRRQLCYLPSTPEASLLLHPLCPNTAGAILGTMKGSGKLVAAHFHCHAPTCLSMTLSNADTGDAAVTRHETPHLACISILIRSFEVTSLPLIANR